MYGETGAPMRAEMAALLRQHRVQQRLVGTTAEEREELGGLIRTYRQTVLVWPVERAGPSDAHARVRLDRICQHQRRGGSRVIPDPRPA